jgi:hypothetical protein
MNWRGEAAFHSMAWTVVREVSASRTQVTVPDTSYRQRPQFRTICKAILSNKVSLGRFVASFVAKTGRATPSPRLRGALRRSRSFASASLSRTAAEGGLCSPQAGRGDPSRGCSAHSNADSIFKQPYYSQTQLYASQRQAPELCIYLPPPKKGVGNAGCPLHPRPRVRFVVVRSTRVTTSTPGSPGIPARNGFNGLCRALPGDRALLPPSSAE